MNPSLLFLKFPCIT